MATNVSEVPDLCSDSMAWNAVLFHYKEITNLNFLSGFAPIMEFFENYVSILLEKVLR